MIQSLYVPLDGGTIEIPKGAEVLDAYLMPGYVVLTVKVGNRQRKPRNHSSAFTQ